MTDPTAQGQPSPEELQAYLEQLRTADVTEVIVQAFNMLGTGANVKLGRPDARVVIDALDALTRAVDGHIDPSLLQQMQAGVSQLKTAQVEAEREAAQPGARAEGPDASVAEATGGPSDAPAPDGAGEDPSGQKMTDRLWIPGRGPAPDA